MAQYNEIYLLNSSQAQQVTTDQLTVVPTIPLTSTNRVLLTINGVVYTGTTSSPTPVNGARVIVYAPDGTPLAEDLTQTIDNQVGAYSLVLEGEKNVTYQITANLDGYNASTTTTIFTNSEAKSISFLLGAESNILAIYGVVVDASTGTGIGNVNIRVVGPEGGVTLTTASDGSFVAYDSFTVGSTYTVTASQLGYDTQVQQVVIAEGNIGKYVTFALNRDNTNLTSITGRVIVEGSNPEVGIANAFVGLFVVTTSENQLIASKLTDEYGMYTFTNVDPNKVYIVKATKIVEVDS